MTMEYIAHHGIKGQKWGIRRFQNADGTLTYAGKKRYSGISQTYMQFQKDPDRVQKIAAGVGAVAAVATAAAYVSRHPEAVTSVAKLLADDAKMNGASIGSAALKSIESSRAAQAGKRYMESAAREAIAGAREGALNAPRKVARAAVEGAAIIAAKKMLDSIIGQQNSMDYMKAYNAYNKKNKIGAMPGKKDDEDD